MKKILYLLFFMLLIQGHAFGALYHMSTTGTRTSGVSAPDDWSDSNCYASLSTVLPQMSGGDELIIDDGVYTGANNALTNAGYYPPEGADGAYTIVRARNIGQVHFDGENTRCMFLMNGDAIGSGGAYSYIEFHGLRWSNGSGDYPAVYLSYVDHLKFFDCGFEESGGDEVGDNEATLGVFYGQYCLFERCWAWGNGRYKFLSYSSEYMVFRQCLARFDWCYDENEPKAGFSIYHSNYVEVQNCIVIDSDTRSMWPTNTQTTQVDGCFYAPNNSNYSTYISFAGCIAVNNDFPFSTTSGDGSTGSGGPIQFSNCVGWSVWDGSVTYNANNTDIVSSSFGLFTHPNYGSSYTTEGSTYGFNFYNSGTDDEFDNNILYNIDPGVNGHYVVHGGQLSSLDSNNIYSCTMPNTTNAYASDTNTATYDPTSNGLLYLPRVESGSQLATDGIGASVMYKIGVDGTLYGEDGYATLTDSELWPWTNEDVIKAHMQEYDRHGVSGNRGFASSTATSIDGSEQTLTKYIWEYLGNQMPADIYGTETAPTVNAGSDQNVFTDSATIGGMYTIEDGRTIASCTWSNDQGGSGSLTATGGTISGTVTGLSSGANVITITLTDSEAEEGSDSLTITYTPSVSSSATVRGAAMKGAFYQ